METEPFTAMIYSPVPTPFSARSLHDSELTWDRRDSAHRGNPKGLRRTVVVRTIFVPLFFGGWRPCGLPQVAGQEPPTGLGKE